ncbi:MAG: glycosyltransferase family 10 [Pirellulales bacterium]|nr:glycosyltransferase family 10 [Pirellulales bacterium]
MRLYIDPSVGFDFFWPNHIVAVALQAVCNHPIELVSESNCDLAIVGPYANNEARGLYRRAKAKLKIHLARKTRPLRLYLSGENTRPDWSKNDFCIGSDLAVSSPNHYRLPYWQVTLAWPQLKKRGVTYSRFGNLLEIERLQQPLGDSFLSRNGRAIIICGHLTEPRASLMDTLDKQIGIDGFGTAFGSSKHHNKSGVKKIEILSEYSFNLCPENGLHPGYYTEKIPEAFYAGCLPLAWADPMVSHDFNPAAFLNFYEGSSSGFDAIAESLNDKSRLKGFADQPLLRERPRIEPLYEFLERVVAAT